MFNLFHDMHGQYPLEVVQFRRVIGLMKRRRNGLEET